MSVFFMYDVFPFGVTFIGEEWTLLVKYMCLPNTKIRFFKSMSKKQAQARS